MAPESSDHRVPPSQPDTQLDTQLDAQLAELSRLAEQVAHHAYAPYSRFFVGAAILLDSGEIVSGCNVENSSFRLTTCAEQNAIAAAVARFGPAIRIRAVAVHNLNQSACQPCGACRQTISEFASPSATIVYPTSGGTAKCTLAELLPSSFHLAEVKSN
jgi:cytidine deaminase